MEFRREDGDCAGGVEGEKIGSSDLSGASDKPGIVLSVAGQVFGSRSERIKQWGQ